MGFAAQCWVAPSPPSPRGGAPPHRWQQRGRSTARTWGWSKHRVSSRGVGGGWAHLDAACSGGMGVRLGGSGKVGRNERRGALDSSGVDVDVAGLPASLRRALAVSAAAVFLSLSLAGPSQANFLFDTPDEKDPVEPFSVFGTGGFILGCRV